MDDATWLKIVDRLDATALDAIEHGNERLARVLLAGYAAIGRPTSGAQCETLDAWLADRRRAVPRVARLDMAHILLNPLLRSGERLALDTGLSVASVNQERRLVRVRNNLPTNFNGDGRRGKSNPVAPQVEPASGFTYAEILSAVNPADPWLEDAFYLFRAWAWARRCYAGMLERAGLDTCPYAQGVTVESLRYNNVADDDPAYLHFASRYINRRVANYMCLPLPAYSYANASKAPNSNRTHPAAGNSFTSNGRGITKVQLATLIKAEAVKYPRDWHPYIHGWDQFNEGEA